MKISRLNLQALLVALVLSAGCTLLLGRGLSRRAATQQSRMRKYWTAMRAIEPGEVLSASDLRPLPWPGTDPVSGALDQADAIIGRVVLYPLAPGQPVLDRELAIAGSGPGLASKIPNGMRAIALKSDEIVGVAGFLTPGSHVDILVTYRSDGPLEPVAATVLQNAEVIAAGQQTEPDPAGKAVSATVVTLLLTPQQAERALLASSQGSIHFVLRNSADTVAASSAIVTFSELIGSPAPRVATTQLAAETVTPPEPEGRSRGRLRRAPAAVEIVLGDQIEEAKQ